jgi:hypothetical protein
VSNQDEMRARATSLLRGARPDEPEPVDASPSVAEVGAIDGVAFGWPPTTARSNAYVFDDYYAAIDAERALLMNRDDAARIASTINGPLLLWATAATDDVDGAAVLDDLLASFSGRE